MSSKVAIKPVPSRRTPAMGARIPPAAAPIKRFTRPNILVKKKKAMIPISPGEAVWRPLGRRFEVGAVNSPRTTPTMADTPSTMPWSNRPILNWGTMIFRIMRPATRSVSLPSRPYPTSMRILRSFFATNNSTPLSTSFWPICQPSTTARENSSRTCPSREGMVSTTIWVESVCSNLDKADSSWFDMEGWIILARSFTRPLRGGTSKADTGWANTNRVNAAAKILSDQR